MLLNYYGFIWYALKKNFFPAFCVFSNNNDSPSKIKKHSVFSMKAHVQNQWKKYFLIAIPVFFFFKHSHSFLCFTTLLNKLLKFKRRVIKPFLDFGGSENIPLRWTTQGFDSPAPPGCASSSLQFCKKLKKKKEATKNTLQAPLGQIIKFLIRQ